MFSDPDLRLLLDAAAAGDDRAVADLVRATQVHVLRLCTHIAGRGVAEDLAQDTYVRMLHAMHGFRGEAPVLVWLLSIARNVCRDHVRRDVRRNVIVGRFPARVRDVAPDHSTEVRVLLDDLDDDRRLAFELVAVLGFTYEEAADLCGCPVGTIRSRVSRARDALANAVRESA